MNKLTSDDLIQIRIILRDKLSELDLKISTFGDYDGYWTSEKSKLDKLLIKLECIDD